MGAYCIVCALFLGDMDMKIVKNAYFDQFQCIANHCPDSCCKEWDVAVDAESAALYRSLPGKLGDRLRQVLTDEDGQTYMTIQEGRCPMWRQDGLCRIQAELGHEALCKTCRDFPRLTHDYGDFVEYTLELSCPEVARVILNNPHLHPVITSVPGGDEPEYDREAMGILLRTREEMYRMLSTPLPIGEALALGLLYAYHAQAELDGLDAPDFQAETALETARTMGKPGDIAQIIAFYQGLEILTDQWRSRLAAPSPSLWSEPLRQLAIYGVERYWLQAVSDYDLAGRMKMVILSCLLVKNLGGDPVQTAQIYSKEIENSTDNIDAILDAAYGNPAFTDDKLLWLLCR